MYQEAPFSASELGGLGAYLHVASVALSTPAVSELSPPQGPRVQEGGCLSQQVRKARCFPGREEEKGCSRVCVVPGQKKRHFMYKLDCTACAHNPR